MESPKPMEHCPSCRRPVSLCSHDEELPPPLTPLTPLPLWLEDRWPVPATPKDGGSTDQQVDQPESGSYPSPSLQPQSFSSLLFADAQSSEPFVWNNPNPFEPTLPGLECRKFLRHIPELESEVNVRAADINETLNLEATPRSSGMTKIEGLFNELRLGPDSSEKE